MTTEQQQIAPCPFCGGECYVIGGDPVWQVRCTYVLACEYRSGTAHKRADVIAAHNAICRDKQLAALVPRLAEALRRVGIWIVHADGSVTGITAEEINELLKEVEALT